MPTPSRLQRWHGGVARWPSGVTAWTLAAAICAMAVVDAFWLHAATGIARSTYDTMVRWRVHAAAPDPRVVILDIDEASLAALGKEFGRWPWPRDTLATVLNHIEAQKPAAIVWDISFSDADRINPGGDAAFAQAAARSQHSHFSVIRLPAANDGQSQLTAAQLPSLWLAPEWTGRSAPSTATVALIAPALDALARSELALNNAEPDRDGVIRRYRMAHALADGSALKSMPLSVALANASPERRAAVAQRAVDLGTELVVWRKRVGAYPRVRFVDAFTAAEATQGKPPTQTPFAGKVVVIGSTAPSLHDIHPTPLSPTMPGVESLATVIDNALNERSQWQLPKYAQTALAMALCVGLVLTTRSRGSAGVGRLMLWLPAALLLISFASMHTPYFLDLHLALGFGMVLLALLGVLDALRRAHWMAQLWPGELRLDGADSGVALVSIRAAHEVDDAELNRLFDALAIRSPHAKVISTQPAIPMLGRHAWPHAAAMISVLCVEADCKQARQILVQLFDSNHMATLLLHADGQGVTSMLDPQAVSRAIFQHWSELLGQPTTHAQGDLPS